MIVHMVMHNVLLAALLVMTACQTATDSRPHPPTTSTKVDCTHDPIAFPSFDRACSNKAACVLEFHRVDCCGGLDADGIRNNAQAAFENAKATCEEQWSHRNCPPCVTRPPTSTEDGQSSMTDDKITVDCIAGRCTSVLLP